MILGSDLGSDLGYISWCRIHEQWKRETASSLADFFSNNDILIAGEQSLFFHIFFSSYDAIRWSFHWSIFLRRNCSSSFCLLLLLESPNGTTKVAPWLEQKENDEKKTQEEEEASFSIQHPYASLRRDCISFVSCFVSVIAWRTLLRTCLARRECKTNHERKSHKKMAFAKVSFFLQTPWIPSTMGFFDFHSIIVYVSASCVLLFAVTNTFFEEGSFDILLNVQVFKESTQKREIVNQEGTGSASNGVRHESLQERKEDVPTHMMYTMYKHNILCDLRFWCRFLS